MIPTIAPTDTWRGQAACLGVDQDVFFWDQGAGKRGDINRARAICNRCPVQEPCLAYAIRTNPQFGFIGGLTVRERRAYRREMAS